MINVKEKKTERTEKIGKGQTAPKRKKTATVERIAQAIGSKRFLAIVLLCLGGVPCSEHVCRLFRFA